MNAPAPQYAQSDPIAAYLARLGAAAYGLDAALVHDMLADAEDHLRSAVREGIDPLQAVSDFGSPDDVVAAYLSADRRRNSISSAKSPSEAAGGRGGYGKGKNYAAASGSAASSVASAGWNAGGGASAANSGGGADSSSSAPVFTQPRKPLPAPYTLPEPLPTPRSRLINIPLLGVWFDGYAWGSLILFIVGLVPAVLYFTLMVGGVSLAIGLIPSLIGIPLLILVLGLARILSLWHGMTIESLTGVRMPRRYAPIPATGAESIWGRLKVWLTDGRSWLSAFYLIGNLPVATLLFSLFVTLLSLAGSFTAVALADLFGGHDVWIQINDGVHPMSDMFPNGISEPPAFVKVLMLIAGLLLATCTLYLARGTGWLYAQAAKAIQVSRPNPIPV